MLLLQNKNQKSITLIFHIDFCFLFWSCKFSNFLVTVDNILWLSSSKKEHLLILSSIFNDSVKLSVSSSISSTSSSSSLSSSEISCAMLFSFKTTLMQSSRNFCCQSILCSLIRGLDAGISASKFTYAVAETSRHNSWTSISNSKSVGRKRCEKVSQNIDQRVKHCKK